MKPRPAVEVPAGLEDRLGVSFADPSLLVQALAHRSWCGENGRPESNERLEFLGDSVLGLVVSHHAYTTCPALSEGQLSEVRAGVVNARVLAEVATELGIGDALLLGRGEDAAGGRSKPSILSDAMEAVIAAVFIDGGLEAAREFVVRVFGDRIARLSEGGGEREYKTRLQELMAARDLGRPRYVVTDEGPDHRKSFHAVVYVGEAVLGEGDGRSKKEAEQGAAWQAWCCLSGGRDDG